MISLRKIVIVHENDFNIQTIQRMKNKNLSPFSHQLHFPRTTTRIILHVFIQKMFMHIWAYIFHMQKLKLFVFNLLYVYIQYLYLICLFFANCFHANIYRAISFFFLVTQSFITQKFISFNQFSTGEHL